MPPNTTVHTEQLNLSDNAGLISFTELFDGAWKVVSSVFPTWKKEDLKFVQCKDGITNQLVRITETNIKKSVLVRAYGKGSERIIDRRQEIINIITLSNQKLGPPLYARFKNGLIYGFIEGRVSAVDDLGKLDMAKRIATRLAQWHKVEISTNQRDQKLWKTMRDWLKQVPDKYDNPKTQATFEKRFDMKHIAAELESLIDQLESLNSPIVFSHNDLLYGNIIFDDEKDEAHFIDYEYGCYAFRGFDIGNHFNEHCGFECDYSKYPSKEFQYKWLEYYLTSSNNGEKPTLKQIDQIYKEVDGFSLASHFYWGLWAMIQAMVSDIDFDYMEYAVLRFDEYDKRKEQILNDLAI
ncbi:unnamed protein product [Cunninghamella blakesleeana]